MKNVITSIMINFTHRNDSPLLWSHYCNYWQSIVLKKMYLEKHGNADLTITESVRISQFIHTPTCVKPSLIRLCLKVLANCSSSSRSLGSSRVGVSNRLGGVWLWGRDWIGVAAVVRVGVAGCREQQNIKMGLFWKDKEEGKCRSISSGKKKANI